MTAFVDFAQFIISGLLGLLIWAIIINAVLSWLVAFQVINTRNQFVYQVLKTLDMITYPVLEPFRRFIPNLGGLDISPIIAILVLQGIQGILLPRAFEALRILLG